MVNILIRNAVIPRDIHRHASEKSGFATSKAYRFFTGLEEDAEARGERHVHISVDLARV